MKTVAKAMNDQIHGCAPRAPSRPTAARLADRGRTSATMPAPRKNTRATSPNRNVVSLMVKLAASRPPATTRCRGRGSVRALATARSSPRLTSPTRESSRPVRVTVRIVGLMVNSTAATGAPTRPSNRVEVAMTAVAATPASAATNRAWAAPVPNVSSTAPSR